MYRARRVAALHKALLLLLFLAVMVACNEVFGKQVEDWVVAAEQTQMAGSSTTQRLGVLAAVQTACILVPLCPVSVAQVASARLLGDAASAILVCTVAGVAAVCASVTLLCMWPEVLRPRRGDANKQREFVCGLLHNACGLPLLVALRLAADDREVGAQMAMLSAAVVVVGFGCTFTAMGIADVPLAFSPLPGIAIGLCDAVCAAAMSHCHADVLFHGSGVGAELGRRPTRT